MMLRSRNALNAALNLRKNHNSRREISSWVNNQWMNANTVTSTSTDRSTNADRIVIMSTNNGYSKNMNIATQYRFLSTKNEESVKEEEKDVNADTTNDNEDNKTDESKVNADMDSNTDEKENETEKSSKKEEKESLRDTINRLNSSSSDDKSSSIKSDDILRNLSSAYDTFSTSLSETWDELINSNKPKDINKKLSDIHASKPGNVRDDDNDAADKYEGTTAVMIIDEDENLTAYERIQRRLSEAPILQDIYKRAGDVYEASGADKAREKISHVKEDAQEAWETSQNPWVYRVSSVYDTITAESETAMAERELRVLDPNFDLESWKIDVKEVTLPKFMQMFLEGRIKDLKPSLGEGVYNRLAAESRARKKEGVFIDTNVLSIMNVEILNCVPDIVNKGSPIIALHFMCQQINCVRKKETNEITEGSEDDIRAYSYTIALQREYDEEKGELNWKIIEFAMNGAIAYL